MQLIGMLDSPYVRRVAISLKCLDLPFEHLPLSVFRNMPEFSQINPLIKAPTLVCDDGEILIDSTLILDYLERLSGKSLMPESLSDYQRALHRIGIALVACEKSVQIFYERSLRPADKRHQPWIDRVADQLKQSYGLLEAAAAQEQWSIEEPLTQSDITVAVSWRFTQYVVPDVIDPADYPTLARFSAEAEQLPVFASTPLE